MKMNTYKIRVSDIEWETDGEDVDLPDEMEIPSDIEGDEIESYLSNETGFLVLSYLVQHEKKKVK